MKEENKLLTQFGNSNGFKVPEGYFENLTEQVMQNIDNTKVIELPKLSTWDRVKPYLYLAAMFVGITLMLRVYTGFTSSQQSNDEMTLELTNDDVLLSSVDAYTIYEYLITSDENQ